MIRITIQFLFIFCTIVATCRPGLAHKVRIFAWQDGEHIITESKFSRGKPAQNATVVVVETASGKNLLSGTTDSEGLFSFPIPQIESQQLEIIVDGGDGHKNSWTYTLEPAAHESTGLTTLPAKAQIDNQLQPASLPQSAPEQLTANEMGESVLQSISAAELTRIIETTMDKKLAPIKRTLAENSEQGPRIQDILGGIGYILGLAGIAAYMQSLKNKKE